MTGKMWPLRSFRYDEQIVADEVCLPVGPGETLEPMTRDAALALARARGLNLVADWPGDEESGAPSCVLAKVSLPVRWERLPEPDPLGGLDERLWFEAPCGGRDLITGSGNTYPGRMSAWCPQKRVGYNVSLSEMGDMSEQSRYFVAGFLAGNAPDAPDDADHEIEPDDLAAWIAATARFRRTGSWLGRWNTCQACGCVLLPDSAAKRCAEHAEH